MFGWFKPKPRTVDEPDEVYRTRARADQALVAGASGSTPPVVVASFFPASLERIEALLDRAGTPFQRLSFRSGAPSALASVRTLDASRLVHDYGFDAWLLGTGRTHSFLFIEHHPLRSVEKVVLDVLDDVSRVTVQRVRFFVGLDEPFMRAFGGERILRLMDQLGMGAADVIQHSMVDRSIEKAQQKMEKATPNAVPTRSVEEWFERNLPGRS
jgi:hypothetical protein